MRLTAELINNSLSYLNPLHERELDLRGHRIPAIENLGAVAKDHESLDLTDNDIAALANFPLAPRMQTLLCARNRIATLQPSLAKSLPNLHTLVLSSNLVSELADLDPLQGFTKLTHLSLIDNPVASKENYRYYVLWRNPHIRFLDFAKVKDAERARATELFGTLEAPSALAQQIQATRGGTAASRYSAMAATTTSAASSKKLKLTEKEEARFRALVLKAKTLEEVQKLEKAHREGRLPPGVMDGEAMDET